MKLSYDIVFNREITLDCIDDNSFNLYAFIDLKCFPFFHFKSRMFMGMLSKYMFTFLIISDTFIKV